MKRLDAPEDANVSFRDGSLSWTKVGPHNEELSGATFKVEGPFKSQTDLSNPTVANPDGGWPVGEVKDCTTADCSNTLDKDPAPGKFLIKGLPRGFYKLTEVTAPVGYIRSSETFWAELTLADQQSGTAKTFSSPTTADGKILNSLGSLAWNKKDTSGNLLNGSEWKLTGGDRQQDGDTWTITDCIGGDCAGMTDKDPIAGQFKVVDLPTGSYTLIETKAPAGHELLPQAAWTGKITEDTPNVTGINITDVGAVVEMLPKTGGMGQLPLALAGLALVSLGALLARRRGA